MTAQVNTLVSQSTRCHHCNESVVTPFHDSEEHLFCCQGCLSVYQILHNSNLEEFYNIQKETGEYSRSLKNFEPKNFSYLNDEDFLKSYASLDEKTNRWSLSFYLKGVHCLACLWLIEKLPEISQSVASSRLDMGKSLVTVTLREGETSFQEAARNLNNLGYEPYPVSSVDEISNLQRKEERSLLLRIGVAGFSAMNIMLYTGSVYAGADGLYQISFGYLSLLLSLPVVFYSALPFYKSSLASIKNDRVNIDIPLSLAILFGFSVSVYFVLLNKDQFYFDSITTLVFLILLSRFVLRKAQQTNLNQNDILSLFQRGTVHKVLSERTKELKDIHPDQLKKGDLIEVFPSEVIPCDGIITNGKTRLNLSALTGESEPVIHAKGSHVFMGTSNVGNSILIEVTELKERTRIGRLLSQVESEEKKRSAYSYLTDNVSRYFVNIVFSVAVVAFVYFYIAHGLEKALEHTLAFIIVTCPCALGLATPLTFSRAMGIGQKLGLIFKNESAIERLAKTSSVFFDKTGTLTTGNYEVTDSINYDPSFTIEEVTNIIFSLESNSNHPVAKALVRWSARNNGELKKVQLSNVVETLGKGISGEFKGSIYSVFTRDKNDGQSEAVLQRDGTTLLSLTLNDKIREDSKSSLKAIRENKLRTFLLSGDKESVVKKVASALEFKPEHVFSQCQPEKKAELISKYDNTLFVGDGANDSLALSKATTSIATHSSLEVSLRVSDIFLNEDKLDLIPKGIELSQKTMRTVRINLVFSLLYNTAGAFLALGGFIGPLEAAVLMPLSSLTILVITLYRTRGANSGNS